MRSPNPSAQASERPAYKSTGHYRYQALILHSMWAALGLHALFFIFFAAIGHSGLAAFNVVSVMLYALLTGQLRRERFTLSVLLTTAEVILHAWLALSALGLQSGFQYYILVLVPAAFFHPQWKLANKILYLTAVCAAFLAIDTHLVMTAARPDMAVETLMVTRVFNIVAVFGFLGYVTGFYASVARRAEQDLEQMATVDLLTGLHNRRHMLRMVELERMRQVRNGRPAAVIMADIDDFKRFNDQYGHACGDEVLKHVARCMRRVMRGQDHIARWGGEEFLLLLPETNLEGGRVLAEKLRNCLIREPFMLAGSPLPITLTAAVAELAPTDDFEFVLTCVDKAMLDGKRNGKNLVVSVPHTGKPPHSSPPAAGGL